MEGFQAVLSQRFGKLQGDLPIAFVEALASVNKHNARLFALAGETHFDRLCPFTDTSLCRLGRYRLQIWEEPLRFFNWLVHNRKTLYLHN